MPLSIRIDPEFSSLIQPPTAEEYAQLERDILRGKGARDPIVLWGEILLDGHTRYEICRKHKLPFKTVQRKCSSRNAARFFIIRNQLGRRNLQSYARIELALALEPTIAKQAKARQQAAGRQKLPQKSAEPPRHRETREQLAKMAQVSRDTLAKGKLIAARAPAKEAQATDRVYRLGQTRDVAVYYPVATDPLGQFETFDEKLDALLQRRRALASEFLSPIAMEDDIGRELLDSLGSGVEPADAPMRLAPEAVKQLSWSQFEALAAALEEAKGSRVCVTPLTGDDGVDVIACRGAELRLIQCKHTTYGARVDEDVVVEALAGYEAYRAKFLTARQRQGKVVPVLVTNGEYSRAARRTASANGVALLSGTEIQMENMNSTLGKPAIERMSRQRLASMGAVKAWLESGDGRS